jgi:hypothetical protein
VRDRRPLVTARRRTRQQDREEQGLSVPPCVLCIEAHHPAGRHNDAELTTPLCQKHHREMHEEMLREGISLSVEHNNRKRIATALRATAIYDRARADAMERWADSLDQSKEHNDDV